MLQMGHVRRPDALEYLSSNGCFAGRCSPGYTNDDGFLHDSRLGLVAATHATATAAPAHISRQVARRGDRIALGVGGKQG